MIRYIGLLLSVVFGLLLSGHAHAEPVNVLVIYPKLTSAYDQVFAEILTGISSNDDVIPHTYILGPNTNARELEAQLEAKKIDAVIALGQASYELTAQFKRKNTIVYGGMMLTPNHHSGISITASPERFFASIKELAPPVKRVYTVYNEASNGWMIEIARQAAKKQRIELHALEAEDVRQGALQFRKIFSQVKSAADAVWLLPDPAVPESVVLPLALEAAWERSIVLFSSNPTHTRRGALFALYPDYEKMGYNLAAMALKQLTADARPSVVPLTDLKIAVNERTASHLGVRYSGDQRETFDLIYPPR